MSALLFFDYTEIVIPTGMMSVPCLCQYFWFPNLLKPEETRKELGGLDVSSYNGNEHAKEKQD